MTITESVYIEACGDCAGYCTACDDITVDGGVEPDAEGYKCPACDGMTVMGIEQALLVGKLGLDGE